MRRALSTVKASVTYRPCHRSMWLDFAAAVLNVRTDRGPEYLLGEVPIAMLLAFAAGSRYVMRK